MTGHCQISLEKTKLIEMSNAARAQRKAWTETAESEEHALWLAALTVNDILMIMHEKKSDHTTFKTFHGWKEAGFRVKRGEKSYRIWGKPRAVTSKDGQSVNPGENADSYEFFPMCCLFHDGQVEPIAAPEPSSGAGETANL